MPPFGSSKVLGDSAPDRYSRWAFPVCKGRGTGGIFSPVGKEKEMKFYVECFPGEKPSENTELYECPSCGAVCPYGHCSHSEKMDDEWPKAKMVVKVFDHHGSLKNSPPACQQVWEYLKDGGKVGENDEIILPKNVDPDALLAATLLKNVQGEMFLRPYSQYAGMGGIEVLEALESLVEEVATADLGKGLLKSKGGELLRLYSWYAGMTREIKVPNLGEIFGGWREDEWDMFLMGKATAQLEQQDKDNTPVLLPCGQGVAVLQRGNAKRVKASEVKVLIIPFLDRKGKQAYSISSPNPGGADLAPILEALNEVEPGWGGRAIPGGILGDPKPGHTELTLRQIIDTCLRGIEAFSYQAYLDGKMQDPRD